MTNLPFCFCLLLQEPSNKHVRSLGRVTSLANLISPVKNGVFRRFAQTIKVSAHGIQWKHSALGGQGHPFQHV